MNYLLFFFILLSSYQEIRVSTNSINGIYKTRNVLSDKYNFAFAICKNSKDKIVKVGIESVDNEIHPIADNESNLKQIEPSSGLKKRVDALEYWKPSSDDMLVSKEKSENKSIKYDDGNFLIYYIGLDNSKIYGASFFYDDDFVYSFVGEKVTDEFEIIDYKTMKVNEICKSR